MKNILKLDLYRYVGNKCNSLSTQIRYLIFTPGFQFIYFFRKASYSKNPLLKLYWPILHRLCMFKFGIQIPVGTVIGPGLRISHFGAIVVNPQAHIGNNFSISQGCLIGNSGGKRGSSDISSDTAVVKGVQA